MEGMRPAPKKRQETLQGLQSGKGVELLQTEKGPVELTWTEFSPTTETPGDEAIISLPGWMGRDATTLQVLSEQLARFSERNTLQITTRADNRSENSLEQEARAVRDYIVKKGLKRVTLTGHSQGGTKAVDVIALLQRENPEIEVNGLILFDPVGIYEQTQGQLVRTFLKDALVKTPGTMLRNPSTITQNLKTSSDIIFNIAREIGHQGTSYLEKFRSELHDMARANNHYQEIRCPVVLVQGADDQVSSPERVLPNVADVKTLSERDELLRETFFPASPRVDMLTPDKLGNHNLPLVRQEQAAKVALYLLERQRRRTEVPSNESATE